MAMTGRGRAFLDRLRKKDPSPEQRELPWGGRSPRALTRAFNLFRLGHETTTVNEVVDPDDAKIDEQYRRFIHGS